MSQQKGLNIVAFQFPYPANYGGAIEVFEKLKALKDAGFYIILHAFMYDREYDSHIEHYADEIYCYTRKKRILDQLYIKPFIVKSRETDDLLRNLCKNKYPILFEGLHTCAFLDSELLKNRAKWVRAHNIEHDYYNSLSSGKCSFAKKMYFKLEARKLKLYERVLISSDAILAITEKDKKYFISEYAQPKTDVIHLPCFSPEPQRIKGLSVKKQILYHGNLAVIENQTAVNYILDNYPDGFDAPLIIAGANPPEYLKQKIAQCKFNTQLIENPSDSELSELIQSSKVNLLLTFQATGIKLKLINALRLGTYIVVNPEMTEGTGLENLCITTSLTDLQREVNARINAPLPDSDIISQRDAQLSNILSNKKSVTVLEKLYNKQFLCL